MLALIGILGLLSSLLSVGALKVRGLMSVSKERTAVCIMILSYTLTEVKNRASYWP